MLAGSDCEKAIPANATPGKKTQARNRVKLTELEIRIMVSVTVKCALERSMVAELFQTDPRLLEQKRNENQ